MDPVLAAKVWHYWLSFALFGLAALALVGTVIGYLLKITANKFPRQ